MKPVLKISLFIFFFYTFLFNICSVAKANHICEYDRLNQTIKKNRKNVFLVRVVFLNSENNLRTSSGSAFVIDKNGILATARHLFIAKRLLSIQLIIEERDRILIKSPYFLRIHKTADVAIFKVHYRFKSQVVFSHSGRLVSPKLLYYIGYPVISKTVLTFQKVGIGRFFGYRRIFFPSHSINYIAQISTLPALGGASGSPVFDSYGRLVGVVCFISRANKHSRSFTGSTPFKYILDLL